MFMRLMIAVLAVFVVGASLVNWNFEAMRQEVEKDEPLGAQVVGPTYQFGIIGRYRKLHRDGRPWRLYRAGLWICGTAVAGFFTLGSIAQAFH